MFPLQTESLPANPHALREALEQSLSRVLRPATGEMVKVEDRDYPELNAIHVTLDNAIAGDRPPPRVAPPSGTIEPALRVEHFQISGKPVRVQGAAIDLTCRAREVEIGQGRDAEGKIVLLLRNAVDGHVEVSIPMADLEQLVRKAATEAAKKQGVILEDVQVRLSSRTDRALDVEVQVRARKLFLTAAVQMKGSLEIDEQLNAHLAGLDCAGEGTLGTMACGFLGPHLQRLEGRDFSLLALPLGEVKLRDVRIKVGTELRVTADFGQAAA